MSLDASDGLDADASLSSRLSRLAETNDDIAWPDHVTSAMSELKDAANRVERLVKQVSGSASGLGELAADMAADVDAQDPATPRAGAAAR